MQPEETQKKRLLKNSSVLCMNKLRRHSHCLNPSLFKEMLRALGALILWSLSKVQASCPNECNDRGTCDKYSRYVKKKRKLFLLKRFILVALVMTGFGELIAQNIYVRLGQPGLMNPSELIQLTSSLSAPTGEFAIERMVLKRGNNVIGWIFYVAVCFRYMQLHERIYRGCL